MVIPLTLPGKQGPHFLIPLARDTVFSQVLDACAARQCNLQTELVLEHSGLFSQFSGRIYMASPRSFDAYTRYSVKGSKL